MSGDPVEAARELLLAEIKRATVQLRSMRDTTKRPEVCHTRMASDRRALLDALCEAPADSPHLDLDSEVVGPWVWA